jgi:hypothetical protein
MNINLEQFVGKGVTVTLRGGNILAGTLEAIPWSSFYPFKLGDDIWAVKGNFVRGDDQHPKDIVKIVEIVKTMSTNKQ